MNRIFESHLSIHGKFTPSDSNSISGELSLLNLVVLINADPLAATPWALSPPHLH
ncbi:hypothetical protein LguiA_011043 [Lonicera macranthoides]